MKYLITLSVLILIGLRISAQTQSVPIDTIVYGNVESNFPGGQNAYNALIQKYAHYPAVAAENNVQGCVYIKLTIEKEGTLSNVNIYSGIGSGMDDEALRIIRGSGKWMPAKIKGNSVTTNCIIPVRFNLIDKNSRSIDGNAADTSYLSFITSFASYGIPVSEITNYAGKTIKFVGKVYGTKAVSDTTFILTCGEYNYPKNYVNVVLMGKNTQVDNPKTKLSGYLITGTGTVVNYNGTLIIIVDNKKNYNLIQGYHQHI
jgi:TonB family protein